MSARQQSPQAHTRPPRSAVSRSTPQDIVLMVSIALCIVGGPLSFVAPLLCVPFCRRAHGALRAVAFLLGLLGAIWFFLNTPAIGTSTVRA